MPTVVFACPSCRVPLKLADNTPGQKVRCPRCDSVFAPEAGPPAPSEEQLLDDMVSRWQRRRVAGEAVSAVELCRDNPSLMPQLQRRLDALERINAQAEAAPGVTTAPPPPPPACAQTTLDIRDTRPPAPSGSASVEDGERAGRPSVPGYEILGVLGQGGMGVVYKARQVGLNRVVALKMILHAEHAGEEQRRRFRSEAEAVARLQHPNIVQVHEVGEHGGLPYFSLEFCSGGSLADKLDGTPLPPAEAARLVQTLATAMQAAHEAGVVHRDLKPANVLLAADGTPKVTDFGLAKRLDEAGQTQTGAVMGTPSYMAPEQAGGRKDVGPAADEYALGAILYELLTGRPPFRAATVMDTLLQVMRDEPVPPAQLQSKTPKDLETVCLKCLQKEPRKRYADCRALADDLRRWLAGEPVTARRAGWGERTSKWARRNPVVAALSLLLTVGLVGGLIASLVVAIRMQILADGERNARIDSQQAQEQARTRGEEVRRQLSRQYVANGERALAAEDYSLALLWFVKALEVDEGDPDREPVHRVRVAATWHRLPRPTGVIRHDLPIRYSDLSPDGRLVVTGSYDGTARLWRVATGEPVGAVMRHGGYVYCARFSPDGKKVATASGDGTARLWDAATGEPASPPLEHASAVHHLSFDAGGTRLVTACGTPSHLWPPPAGIRPDRDVALRPGKPAAAVWPLSDLSKPVVLPLPQDSQPYRAVFSRDGKRVATGGSGGRVDVWDSATGSLLFGELRHKNHVTQIALNPDGTKLLTIDYEGENSLWDLTANPPSIRPLPGGFLSGGSDNKLEEAEFGTDGTVTLGKKTYDTKSGAVRKERIINGFVTIHETGPNGKGYLLGSRNRLLQVWDVRSGQPTTRTIYRDAINSDIGLLTADRRFVLASTADGCGVRVLDLAGECGGALPLLGSGPVSRAEYSPDGTRIAVSHPGLGCVQVYETSAGRPVSPSLARAAPVNEAEWLYLPVVYSPDGSKLIIGSISQSLQVWDAATFRPVGQPMKSSGTIRDLLLTPDGRRVLHTTVVRGDYLPIEGWDLAEQKRLWPPINTKFRGGHIALSPDGRTFATGNGDFEVCVWDTDSGKQILPTLLHTYQVGIPSFSPDGRWLASPGFDRLVRVWDLSDGHPVATLPMRGTANGTAFSPDGRLLAAIGTNDFRVFDTTTWAVQSLLRSSSTKDEASAQSLPFTPDSRLVVQGYGGVGSVFDARTGEVVTPPLTPVPIPPNRDTIIKLRGDGRQLAVSSAAPYALLIDLRPDARSVSELLRVAEVAAGRRVGPAGGVEDLTTVELQAAFARLQAESSPNVRCTPAEVSAWRRQDIGRLIHPRVLGADNLPLGEVLPLVSQEVAENPNDVHLRGLRAQLYHAKGEHAAVVQDLLEVLPTPQAVSLWWDHFTESTGRTQGWASALETVQRRMEADPTNPRLWRLRGLLRNGLKDRDRALADYREAVARGMDDPHLYMQRSEILVEAGRWDEARVDLRKALEASEVGALRIRLAWVELARRDEPATREALAIAVRWSAETASPAVAEMVASLTAVVGYDPKLAVVLAEKALTAKPKNANVLTSLGGNQLRAGDVAKATATLRSAIEAEGKGGLCRTWLYLALARVRAGDQAEAERWLGKARDWMRGHPDLDWDDRIELQTLLREAESTVPKK